MYILKNDLLSAFFCIIIWKQREIVLLEPELLLNLKQHFYLFIYHSFIPPFAEAANQINYKYKIQYNPVKI